MVTSLFLALVVSQSGRQICCDPMAAFVKDPAFVAVHQSPQALRFAPKEGGNVRFRASDGRLAGGFFVPTQRSNGPVILMVHEWWGLNDYIRREAEWYHEKLGCAVLALDLYDGKVAPTPADAGKLMQSVQPARSLAIINGAIESLKTGAFGHRFQTAGTIGWCFGGGWSHRTAIQGGPFVKACVMYYGMPDTESADLQKLRCPVLMIWAKRDQWINQKVVDGFKDAMSAAKRSLTVLSYDAGHGFANPSNPIYNQKAGDDAGIHTLEFFRRHLGLY